MIQSALAICISSLAFATCLPAGVFVSDKGEVGASWGGYSASAGLGGILGGNGGAKGGLHAEAGTPGGHFAGAGLGGVVGDSGTAGGLYSVAASPGLTASAGSSSSAGVSNNNKVHPNKNSFFDDIFNIPMSALRSVNDLLNKRAKEGGAVGASVGAHVGSKAGAHATHGASASGSAGAGAHASSVASASATAGAHSSSVANGAVGAHGGSGTKYDDIINIPQSVLAAVNRLLNRF